MNLHRKFHASQWTSFLLVIVLFPIWCLTSCNQKEVSGIEMIFVDEAFIQSHISNYDSLRIDSPNQFHYTRTTYFVKDSVTVIVSRDSLQRIRAWFKHDKQGRTLNGAEVYTSTGQIMGKLNYVNGELDGEVKYYYEDGRIRSMGHFKNGHKSGDWYHYDEDGKLVSID